MSNCPECKNENLKIRPTTEDGVEYKAVSCPVCNWWTLEL